jgi:molybdate transport system substrate-binding protein
MATRQVLAELVAAFQQQTGQVVAIESVGGVLAAQRVQAGEAFDVVLLAADAIDRLMASGHLLSSSRVDLFRSPVAVAVRAGSPTPQLGNAAAVRQAVLDAPSISVSTGPSGVQLARQFEAWGITPDIQSRLVQAPAGVPVGALVARGEVALGFQQLSELMNLDGIQVVGTLPADMAIITTFCGALSGTLDTRSPRAAAARQLLNFLASPQTAATKRQHGMEPA